MCPTFVATGDEPADFTLSGSSIGGRVNGRLLDKKGKQLFERSYAAPGLDENIKALADDVIYTITGMPGMATSRIVFVSDKSGRKQVYVCDSDGREVQQVTHDRHGAVSPTISPDASMIAFTSYRSGFPDVRLMDIHSGWEREVSDTPGSSAGPAFSPDGSRLAMVMSFIGNPEIFVSDLNSNTAACISDSVGAPGSPSWHPDGKRIAFSNDDGDGSSIYIVEVPEKEGQANDHGDEGVVVPDQEPGREERVDGRGVALFIAVGREERTIRLIGGSVALRGVRGSGTRFRFVVVEVEFQREFLLQLQQIHRLGEFDVVIVIVIGD